MIFPETQLFVKMFPLELKPSWARNSTTGVPSGAPVTDEVRVMKLLPSGPPLGANVGAVNAGLVVDQLAVVLKLSVNVTAGIPELAMDLIGNTDAESAATRLVARIENRFIGTLPFFRVVNSKVRTIKMLLRFKINRMRIEHTQSFRK